MIITPLLSPLLALILVAVPALAQDVILDQAHNATPITGTWSSGSKAVLTGSGFANPANQSFVYPKTTGVSYSFSDDGHYEISRYRFNGNGSEPTCITGVIAWVHGNYTLLGNGSIIMDALDDGFQQIQDPCAAVSNFVELYNKSEIYQSWRIFQDPTAGFKLHLFGFDGAPVAPQFQVSATPNMLPTSLLRNVSAPPPVTNNKDGLTKQNAIKLGGAAPRRWSRSEAVVAAAGTFVVGLAGLAL
jgi:hypothetical protein